jgi:hypothetical protein
MPRSSGRSLSSIYPQWQTDMNENEIIEAAIKGHASTRDAIRWAMRQERDACSQVLVDKAKDMSLYLDLPCAIERDENGKMIDGKPKRQDRINTLFVASKLILARNET